MAKMTVFRPGTLRKGDDGNLMNPLHWKTQHQLAWLVVIAAGGVAGLIFGWLVSPFSHAADTAIMFTAWIHNPMAYWPWVAIGAVTAGLAYYSADLLTGAD